MNKDKLKEIKVEEMILISGGSEFSRKLGYCVGEYVDFITEFQTFAALACYKKWWLDL